MVSISTDELKRLFMRREDDTISDTHDALRCKRCSTVCTLTVEQSKMLTLEKNKMIPTLVEVCVHIYVCIRCMYI